MAFLSLPTASASAHSVPVSSSPEQGSILASAPRTLELVFDQEVAVEYAQTALTVGQGTPTPIAPDIDGRTVDVDLAAAAGRNADRPAAEWTVGYRLVSANGHPITGALSFTVGTGPGAQALAEQSAAPKGSAESVVVVAGLAAAIAVGIAIWAVRRHTTRGSSSDQSQEGWGAVIGRISAR